MNPDLFLIARDKHTDPVTGKFSHHSQRTFLMNVQGTRYECINPEHQCRAFHGACHEWWSADGWACYIDYDLGAYEFNHVSGETTHVWTEPLCHAHCSADRRFWCADESPYKWADAPCKVLFFDRESGRRTEIQSGMPMPAGDYWAQRERYHIDPHPQFSPKGSAVVYTATDGGGRPTVALTPIKNCLGT